MSDIFRTKSVFPPISNFDARMLSGSLTYIGAAGFEDRATTVLDLLISSRVKIQNAICISYKPVDPRNRETEFKDRIEKVTANASTIDFDRYDPQEFQDNIPSKLASIESSTLIVDISAMSRFLIMIILQSLREVKRELVIAYAQADLYYPTKEEFEKKKNVLLEQDANIEPDFLTDDVFKILHVTSLSSTAMQGAPSLLIAYLTFNHNDIIALHNELYPNCMVLIEGEPPSEQNKWRLEAVRVINRRVLSDPDYCKQPPVTLSTFDYLSNIESLDKIYEDYKYTHKILLSPIGSKLQTVAAFMFRQLHPDVQIVYPSTKRFSEKYSKGCKEVSWIRIPDFADFIARLDHLRMER